MNGLFRCYQIEPYQPSFKIKKAFWRKRPLVSFLTGQQTLPLHCYFIQENFLLVSL